MCDFDQKYEFINSLSLFLLADGGQPYRETCSAKQGEFMCPHPHTPLTFACA